MTNYKIAKKPKRLVSFGTSVKTAHACALSILKIDNHINIRFDMKKQTQLPLRKKTNLILDDDLYKKLNCIKLFIFRGCKQNIML